MCKSLFFHFFKSKVHYQAINFFFSGVNQPTIAKMDNFSVLQIIERIHELRFKYMGSYPSDTAPQLTKNFLQLLTQPQAIIEENNGS